MRPDSTYLRIAGIQQESCVDGPGLRMTVFCQGCPHHCQGCHNPLTHSFGGGEPMAIEEIVQLYLENPLLSGITCSGGEPFCQAEAFADLAQMIHELGGNIVTYTGYTLEILTHYPPVSNRPGVKSLLRETDYLVDGPYMECQRNLELPFMGSSNQRFIDLRFANVM